MAHGSNGYITPGFRHNDGKADEKHRGGEKPFVIFAEDKFNFN